MESEFQTSLRSFGAHNRAVSRPSVTAESHVQPNSPIMSDSTFPELMNALVEAAEISDLAIEDDRYACLSVDDNFALHIRFEEGSNEVFVFSSLGEITAESETEICR